MGYKTTVVSNVNKAFKLLGDLSSVLVLSSTTAADFDFATNSVINKTVTSLTVKAVFVSKTGNRKDDKGDMSIDGSFIFKATDVGDISLYDTATNSVTGEVWRLVRPYTNDGFIVTVNVVRQR